MPATVPCSHHDLAADLPRGLALPATLMNDGSTWASPEWMDMEGERFRINAGCGRTDEKNTRAWCRAAPAIINPGDSSRCMQARGHIVGISEAGACDHFDRLSGIIRGNKEHQNCRGETRVTFYIRPESNGTT